ncbi:hypothetical protein CEB3_c50490 [Peptococcaceae bacterium CEB3]|nr:hypothetical protein CEB3_c50490 [Peptococcaceae bacterium CEB3]
MSLTERRKQFLQQIINLYERTGLPVHYITLANQIGVSKWTAYDMLKELEKNGLLKRDYTISPHEPGRSMIVFAPTPAAEELFGKTRTSMCSASELKVMKNSVLGLLNEVRTFRLQQAVDLFLEKISHVNIQAEFCLYILGLLLLYLNALGKKRKQMIEHLINVSNRPEIQMTMFVGTVMGTAVQTVGDELGPEITKLIALFFSYLEKLSPDELQTLTDFIREAVV